MSQLLESQQSHHILPLQVSYGVSIVRIFEKIDYAIKALHCMPLCFSVIVFLVFIFLDYVVLDISKLESWDHVGCTANMIIKDIINIFVSIGKTCILLMGWHYPERWCPHWLRSWLNRWQAITWTNIDQNALHHTVLLSQKELGLPFDVASLEIQHE